MNASQGQFGTAERISKNSGMATFPRQSVSRCQYQAERAEPDNGIKAPRAGKIESDRLEPRKVINAMPVPQITKSRVQLNNETKHQSQQPTPDSTSKPQEQPQQRQNPQQKTRAQEKEPSKSTSDVMYDESILLPPLKDSLGQVRSDTISAKQSFHLEVDQQIEPLRTKIAAIAEKAEQRLNRIDLEKAKAERRKMDEDLLNAISMECVLEKIAKMNEQFVKEWNEIDNNGSQS